MTEVCCECAETRRTAYAVNDAAALLGVNPRLLRAQIHHGLLSAKYVRSKAIIRHEELVDWWNRLPAEFK